VNAGTSQHSLFQCLVFLFIPSNISYWMQSVQLLTYMGYATA